MSSSEVEDSFRRLDHALQIMRYVVGKSGETLKSEKVSERAQLVAELIPGTANIALAMRELLEKRLLSPTEVLLRAFLDRVGTIAFFRVKGKEAMNLWKQGWRSRKRPSFHDKLDMLPDEIGAHSSSADPNKIFSTERLKREIINLKNSLHGAVHGGPESVKNTFVGKDGALELHTIGPDNVNQSYFSTLCHLATISIMLFVYEVESAFDLRGKEFLK